MPPNVIVVVLDACRRDALEPYGAAAGATPTISQLASRGAALDEVYATGCWTAPSHASIFTGKLPRALGLAGVPDGTPSDVKVRIEAERRRFLPEVLRRAGYRTAAASANPWVSPASGYGTGFDSFAEVVSGRHAELNRASARARLAWWREAVRARADDGAAGVEREVRSSTEQSSEPFFCFVNLVECHSPYLPPRPYAAGSALERIRVAEDARRHYTLEGIWMACLGGAGPSEAALARLRRQYAASIRYMDDWLARLLDTLDSAGRLDDTLLIVTADHGENFGEGGLIAHALSLDNRLIHVPFIVAGPGAGDQELHTLAGLPRFIAESVGLSEHPWGEDELPRDVGVAQFDPVVERHDPYAAETVLERWGLDEEALDMFTTPLTCAVSGSRKLLRRGEEDLWIDLARDPLELDPAPASTAPAADRVELERLQAALEHGGVTSTRPFRDDLQSTASPEELDELEKRMRLLGYL